MTGGPLIFTCIITIICVIICIRGLLIYKKDHRLQAMRDTLSIKTQICLPLVSLDAKFVFDTWFLANIFEGYDFEKQPILSIEWLELKVNSKNFTEDALAEQVSYCLDCRAGKFYRENEIVYRVIDKSIIKNFAGRFYIIKAENTISHKISILRVAFQYWKQLSVGSTWRNSETKFTKFRKS